MGLRRPSRLTRTVPRVIVQALLDLAKSPCHDFHSPARERLSRPANTIAPLRTSGGFKVIAKVTPKGLRSRIEMASKPPTSVLLAPRSGVPNSFSIVVRTTEPISSSQDEIGEGEDHVESESHTPVHQPKYEPPLTIAQQFHLINRRINDKRRLEEVAREESAALERSEQQLKQQQRYASAKAGTCGSPSRSLKTKVRSSPQLDQDECKALFSRDDEPEREDEESGVGMEAMVEAGVMESPDEEDQTSSFHLIADDDPLALLYLIPGAIGSSPSRAHHPLPESAPDGKDDDEDGLAADQLTIFTMLCRESADALWQHDPTHDDVD